MTKTVRIENADTSDHNVVVEVWETVLNGPDILVTSHDISCPTQMASLTIWSGRYLVVKETPKNKT